MKCKHCGSSNLNVIKSGPHNKLICEDCLKFQKFLSAKDKEIFESLTTETEETEKTIEVKGDEKLFNRFKKLSFLVKNCSAITQNNMKISIKDKQNFIERMDEIKNEITCLKRTVLNNIDTEKSKYDKYGNFVNDLLENTEALNEDIPWD